MTSSCLLVGSSAFAETSGQYSQAQVWELMEPACVALGVDSKPCQCIMGEVVGAHGLDAAAYIALEIWTREEEASALKAQLGEDEAMAASERFDLAQNTTCAHRPPQETGTGTANASSAAQGAASASDAASE